MKVRWQMEKDDPKAPMKFEEMKKEFENIYLHTMDWNNKRRKEHNTKDLLKFENNFKELENRRKMQVDKFSEFN